ncbi:hypothetical protein [Oricola thermophila]|uniref:Uncharacterized protein n=1 Tax=Oricola thermophila TaxID=2742145 RepID=A0A6N1V8B7_9HYPH|nr:hypothetical protein [Oricola thermophila]QKV17160.1 hypothetical protein HTY61_01100 [Oricola thermophila]
MFTASRRIRTDTTGHNRRTVALIAAALLLANATALLGLATAAQAGGLPEPLRYAPLSWEKMAPLPKLPPEEGTRTAEAARAETPATVTRDALDPVTTGATERRFSEVPAPALGSGVDGPRRYLLIGFMTLALGAMAAVSMAMFRNLAREISRTDRRRNRH